MRTSIRVWLAAMSLVGGLACGDDGDAAADSSRPKNADADPRRAAWTPRQRPAVCRSWAQAAALQNQGMSDALA